MSKIYTLEGDRDNAEEILLQAIDNYGEDGNLYYMLAKVAQRFEDTESYKKYLNDALRNHQTLSVPITDVKIELNKIK